MKPIEELIKERNEAASVIAEMRGDDTKIDGSDPLNEERWNKANDAYNAADAQIKKSERADEIAAAQAASADQHTGRDSQRGSEGESKEVRDGIKIQEMRDESANFKLGNTREFNAMRKELRAQGTPVGAGGYTIPEGFVPNLEKAMLHFGPMLQVANVMRTADGANLPWPMANDTGNSGALLAENTQDSEQDVTFTELALGAYKYTSKIIRVSNELLTDSAFDMGAELGSMLGERLGRAGNTAFTVGDGSSKPNGVVTASTLGVTAAGAAAITYDEIIDLEHSVDIAYRENASYQFADATLKLLRKLKDSDGRYLWNAPVDGAPGRINGKLYNVNNDVPAATTGLKSVIFGDMSKYKIRQVNDVRLVRMDERYADYDQVAFVALVRWDGDLLNAGTNPVKHLIQA